MAACALSSVVVAIRSVDGGLGLNDIGITVRRGMSDILLRRLRRVKVFIDLMDAERRWISDWMWGFISLIQRLEEVEVYLCHCKSHSELHDIIDGVL